MNDFNLRIADYWHEQAIQQWSLDPCGMVKCDGTMMEQANMIDWHRYFRYAPWLEDAIGFDKYEGKKVLEIGCGLGSDLEQFDRGGAFVHGIDPVARNVEFTQRRLDFFHRTGTVAWGDVRDLSNPANFFDVVYSFGVLHHIPDVEKAIKEIHRVLKPGGELIVGLYNKHSAFYFFDLILTRYILKGGFRERWEKFISRIEYRKNSDATPYVKAYTKREVWDLLSQFYNIRISRHHLKRDNFGAFWRFVPEWILPYLERHLGWYHLARCTKGMES